MIPGAKAHEPNRREGKQLVMEQCSRFYTNKQFSSIKANAKPGEGTKDGKVKVEIRRKGKGERVRALCKVCFFQAMSHRAGHY